MTWIGVFLSGIGTGMVMWVLLPKISKRIFNWLDGIVIVIAPEDKAKEINRYLSDEIRW